MGLWDRLFGSREPVGVMHTANIAVRLGPARSPARTFTTRLAGVTFRNPDGSDRQLLLLRSVEGDELRLIREPDNPYDEDAVAVHSVRLGRQLGYIPEHLAGRLCRQMLEMDADAIVEEIRGGEDGDNVGIAIEVRLYSR